MLLNFAHVVSIVLIWRNPIAEQPLVVFLILTDRCTSVLKYACCAFLDELFHFISLCGEVTSLLLSSPTTFANLLVSFL